MQTETLGDFELYRDQPIGKGGGGEVYKGRQISLNRPVAIKFLSSELTDDESFVLRFRREAECLAKLNDEHIIQVYGAGEYKGSHYFAMEYVPGVPLAKFLERKYKFSLDDIIYIGAAVAKALKAAWECDEQIIHRDIKPSNVMVAFPTAVLESKKLDMKEAKIKVMDFGLARAIKTQASAQDLTMTGTIMGTPRYMSPEQGLGKPLDIRSDLYSLGVVLYELASGKAPFESDTSMGYINMHINTDPISIHNIKPNIPKEMEMVIMKCLRKEPAERYRNPTELIDDFEAIKQKHAPFYAKTQMITTESPAQPKPAPKSRRFPIGLSILLILAILGYIGYRIAMNNPDVQRYIKPNIEPAIIGQPSPETILGDEQMKIINHTGKDINNPFDYGIQIMSFIENTSGEIQTRKLRVEIDWQGKTYIKEKEITLSPKSSSTFTVDFYEPTESEDFYKYRVLLTKP
ncbi:MAG: serine/threonine protein kinase [Planctomycetes bacterium]|nr:serine/threonine protein kinase [Planctomycetota bacterium]